MTAQQIYELAVAFLYEQPDEDEENKSYFLPFLNVCLQEALPYENSIREFEGREMLAAAPLVTGMTETVPYSDSITRAALPYGVAARYFKENMDPGEALYMRTMFVSALERAKKYNAGEIEDVYHNSIQ
ncbi:MAG: hypothetical protein BWY11_00133 [Firmicutes bacterium ADurb.Bin182]|nr:MAG: hypothetical protein BWY11_00133 [Firmicutes bacterium ADurb.Bin182]